MFITHAALYATSEEVFVTVTQSFPDIASTWGLTVSLVKTKGMKIGDKSSFVDDLPMHDQLVKMVKEFFYLDNTISNDGEVDGDMKIRITKTTKAFGCLKSYLFKFGTILLSLKLKSVTPIM